VEWWWWWRRRRRPHQRDGYLVACCRLAQRVEHNQPHRVHVWNRPTLPCAGACLNPISHQYPLTIHQLLHFVPAPVRGCVAGEVNAYIRWCNLLHQRQRHRLQRRRRWWWWRGSGYRLIGNRLRITPRHFDAFSIRGHRNVHRVPGTRRRRHPRLTHRVVKLRPLRSVRHIRAGRCEGGESGHPFSRVHRETAHDGIVLIGHAVQGDRHRLPGKAAAPPPTRRTRRGYCRGTGGSRREVQGCGHRPRSG